MSNSVSKTVSDDTLSRIIQLESAGNPLAKARTSSAMGLGQFVEQTWLNVVRMHCPILLKGRTRGELLKLREDPVLSIEMLARLAEDNAEELGANYSDGDLYLAHFAGVGTARKLLRAAPQTSVSSIMSAAAIDANPSILRGKTSGQVRAWAARKMASAGGHDWIAKWYRNSQFESSRILEAGHRAPLKQQAPGERRMVIAERDWRGSVMVVGLIIVAFVVAYLGVH